ncbi:VCBS repeat-containing protein, partial [Arthrobacter sp. UYEF36]|uniref:FG-GAP repeat domain-containing protein n=1 Tax=Arthrobacter sp. UYEF36 TaxID=1756366 RepID=UPI00339513F2
PRFSHVQDAVGNNSGNSSLANITLPELTVLNAAADTTAPVVREMSISPQTVDVTTASQPVTVTAHITDDISGTTFLFVYLENRSTGTNVYGYMNLTSGTSTDGTFTANLTIPFGGAPGTWTPRFSHVQDAVGNNSGNSSLANITLPELTVLNDRLVAPAEVVFTDKDGTAEDAYTIPATEGVDYLVADKVVPAGTYPGTGTVTVTAKAKTGYILTPGATATWAATFKTTPNPVIPAAVVFTDKDGTAADMYTVPATTGVDYLIADKVVPAGTYPGTGTVTVTAKARPDYVLASGVATTWTATLTTTFASAKKSTDFNGDGRSDLLARDSAGVLWFYPGNGTGAFLTRVKIGSGWNTMTSLTSPGDLNGDGKADLLARDSSGVLWFYPGNGTGTLLTRVKIGSGWNTMTSLTSPGDLNDDGKADLLARDSSGILWFYPGNGTGTLLTRVKIGSGWNAMTALT